MLLDRSYYDYDYARPCEQSLTKQNGVKNDEELKQMLEHFGIHAKKKQLTPEEMREVVLAERGKEAPQASGT